MDNTSKLPTDSGQEGHNTKEITFKRRLLTPGGTWLALVNVSRRSAQISFISDTVHTISLDNLDREVHDVPCVDEWIRHVLAKKDAPVRFETPYDRSNGWVETVRQPDITWRIIAPSGALFYISVFQREDQLIFSTNGYEMTFSLKGFPIEDAEPESDLDFAYAKNFVRKKYLARCLYF